VGETSPTNSTSGDGGSGGATSTASTTTHSTTTHSTTTSTTSTGTGGAGGSEELSACPPDEDLDDLSDSLEGKDQGIDTDADGVPDYLDPDSDGDTIPDAIEGQTKWLGCESPVDSESDGVPDFRDPDSDGNGLGDRHEIYPDGAAYDALRTVADTDEDGVPDYADPDNDGDTILDVDELDDGALVDTDGDGTPDLDDPDSDGDSISDIYEQLADPDGDGVPAFRDLDSDGDGRSDACEAGPDHLLVDPPVDTDHDGKYDFLDLDSDNDGLPDGEEDANHNCIVDEGETDPLDADSDSDGVSDFVEVTLGSDPRDINVTPGSLGKYYFILPYLGPASPEENIVPLRTSLNKGDVAFVVDTTGTMGGTIQTLKLGMQSVIEELKSTIPDLAVGVAGHDDFPIDGYGTPPLDLPFYLAGPTGRVSTQLEDSLAAVATLQTHDGGDDPEGQIAAYYRGLTDRFLEWGSTQLPPSGAIGDTFGSLNFRKDALPILVGITDAPFHNGRRAHLNPGQPAGDLHDAYSFNGIGNFPPPTVDELVAVMKDKQARYIGISTAGHGREGTDPYSDMAFLTDSTDSNVSPAAFGGQCRTGILGTPLAQPDGPITEEDPGGTCRLIFDVDPTGLGLSDSVTQGVKAALESVKIDLRAVASFPDPDPNPIPNGVVEPIDTFIDELSVNFPGGEDEMEPGVPCLALSGAQIKDRWMASDWDQKGQDAINETALRITPGRKICFKIVPKDNVTIEQAAKPLVFRVVLNVRALYGVTEQQFHDETVTEFPVGTPREVIFIVPPAPQ
jgi:hypothetical protein